MGDAYIFTLQPTFTQGLILGQLSILFLVFVLLKYLFFDAASDQPYKSASYQPRLLSEDDQDLAVQEKKAATAEGGGHDTANSGEESADWLNILLHQVRDTILLV